MKEALLLLASLGALVGAGVVVRLQAYWRCSSELRDVARLLELLFAADLVRLALGALVLAPARAAGQVPFVGWARFGFFLSQALFLAWPVGVAALTWKLFTRLGAAPAVVLGASVTLVIGVQYPELRGETLGDAYRCTQAGAVMLAVIGAALGERPDRFRVGRAHLCTLILIAGGAAELAGPYLAEPFAAWWTAQVTWLITLAAVALAAAWSSSWIRTRAS